jgi:hypothetical protein
MLASTAAGEVALGTGVTKYPVTGFWGFWGSTLENFFLGSLNACRQLAFSRGIIMYRLAGTVVNRILLALPWRSIVSISP